MFSIKETATIPYTTSKETTSLNSGKGLVKRI